MTDNATNEFDTERDAQVRLQLKGFRQTAEFSDVWQKDRWKVRIGRNSWTGKYFVKSAN